MSLRSRFSNPGCWSKIPWSNVTAVKHPAVQRYWRSKVRQSNVSCSQVFLILLAGQNPAVKCHCGQMSRGQMSLAVKGPAVKCHLRSNVTCGQIILILNDSQKSRGQMSLAVKCPAVKCHSGQMSLRSNVPRSNVTCGQMSRGQMSLAVKCHLRSNVTWSNVTVVICHKILKWSKVRGQMSCGQMRLWS